MINLLLGPPGGGKSYEAVVYHVLVALQEGRKVITNLPVVVAELAKIEPRAPALLEIRTKSKREGKRPFEVPEDYGDTWRHPEHGYGCLYVIDEAHKAIPRRGFGDDADTKADAKAVDEWYAEHRHELCDVLLISQSYGKLSKAITDQVQVVYRVKKMVAFGKPKAYIRKVQDGVRGDVLAVTERDYQKKYFKLYKSHTRSLASAAEADAKDISPSFRKWYRMSAVFMLIAVLLGLFNVLTDKPKAKQPAAPALRAEGARTEEHADRPAVPASTAAPTPGLVEVVHETREQKQATDAPFDGMGIHVLGAITSKAGKLYLFAISQNGIAVQRLTSDEVRQAGYRIEDVSDCVAKLQYGEAQPFFARCDLPTQGIKPQSPSV